MDTWQYQSAVQDRDSLFDGMGLKNQSEDLLHSYWLLWKMNDNEKCVPAQAAT
jgi:hypothetical protein